MSDEPKAVNAGRGLWHFATGESTVGTLRLTGIPGTFVSFGDALYEGPVLLGATPEEFRRRRAEYHAEGGAWTVEACLEKLRSEDRALDACRDASEVVVWCEHDLFDQLSLVQWLCGFAERGLHGAKLTMVCISEFPGIARFVGLGQLTPDQLGPLFDTRQPVTSEVLRLAAETWHALGSSDPTRMEALLARDTSALPFLAGAILRYLEQFPSVEDGLSRTERASLECVAAGKSAFHELFPAAQDREERPFMGDDTFWRTLRRLASGRSPLVTIEGEGNTARVRIRDAGRAVLEGRGDAIRMKGIHLDRWMGGVHLAGADSPWRFDRGARRLVQTPRRASPP